MKNNPIETAVAYHEQTKHHYNRFAPGPGYLDWASQPDPFRRYDGAPCVLLPPVVEDDAPPYCRIFEPQTLPAGAAPVG